MTQLRATIENIFFLTDIPKSDCMQISHELQESLYSPEH